MSPDEGSTPEGAFSMKRVKSFAAFEPSSRHSLSDAPVAVYTVTIWKHGPSSTALARGFIEGSPCGMTMLIIKRRGRPLSFDASLSGGGGSVRCCAVWKQMLWRLCRSIVTGW